LARRRSLQTAQEPREKLAVLFRLAGRPEHRPGLAGTLELVLSLPPDHAEAELALIRNHGRRRA
jgi:hypothetical protein